MLNITLALGIGLSVGLFGPVLLSNLITYLQNRAILRDLAPHAVEPDRLCDGPHSWINATAYMPPSFESTTIQVCRVCGFIPTLQQMVGAEAIDSIEETNKLRAIETQIYKDFMEKENGDIKDYFDEEIKSGVSFDKLSTIYGAGKTSYTRYGVYKSGRADEIEKVLTKSDA